MKTRRCIVCGEVKPLNHFHIKEKHLHRIVYRNDCIACCRDQPRLTGGGEGRK